MHTNYRKEFSDKNKDEKVNTGEYSIKIISKSKVQMLSIINIKKQNEQLFWTMSLWELLILATVW